MSTLLVITFLASSSPLAVAPAVVHKAEPLPNRVLAASPSLPDPAPSRGDTLLADDDPPRSDLGALLGRAVDGPSEQPLAGVQVVAVGVLGLRALPIYLPIQLAGIAHASGRSSAAVIPNAGFSPLVETVIFTTTTNATGDYLFDVPAGDYTLTYTLAGYTPDERTRPVQANEVLRVDDMRLHPQDPVVTELDSSGGTAVNSAGNSNVQFPPGALPAEEDVRVTYVDNADLPGFFPDGSAPMGFSSFEPEGTVFPAGKEVLWTVEYTGTLPIGTDTLCYWWDGKEQLWRDPVPGKVVDLGNGKKALQAKVPHFSFYGHAAGAVVGQAPNQAGDATVIAANIGQGRGAFGCNGCEINMGTGSVSESYAFNLVPSRGMPLALNLRYDTTNDTPFVFARVPFTITTQVPARATWRIEFQGQVYRGEGYDAEALIDTRNALGERVAPGLYSFTATETFFYDSGAQPSVRAQGAVEVRRGDIWPFGFGWMSSYDTLLVDRTDTVTIIQGDGQYLSFTRDANGAYNAPSEDFSMLVHLFDGRWMRTSPEGMREWYSASGRLERMEDRNGNSHTLDYEPNGQTLPTGAWGLTDRLARITDASGGVYQFGYGADGYVNRVTDPSGRSYQVAHDTAGNLTSITDALGRVTAYEYDANHLLLRVVYPEGDDVNLSYDERRRLVSHEDALGGVRSLQYLNGRNVSSDERGVPTTYLFNEYGAVTQWQNPVQSVNYIWDANRLYRGTDEPYRRFVYDARGSVIEDNSYISLRTTYDPVFHQPASFTDGARNTTLYSYDSRGNRVLTIDAAENEYRDEYDNYGQLVRATDPLNQTITFAYDAAGNPSSLTDAMGFVTQFSYDARGNLTQVRDAENRSSQYGYDAMDRVTLTTDALGRTTNYVYDRNDNLTRVTDARGNATALAYDALNRVTSETDPLGNAAHFTYDAGGNLTQSLDAKGGSATYTRDAGNRLTEEMYSGGGGATYTYNSINDLTGYQDGETRATYVYSNAIPHHPDMMSTELLTPGISTTVSYDYVVAVEASLAAAGQGSEDGEQKTEDGEQRTGGETQPVVASGSVAGLAGQPEGESAATTAPNPQPDTSTELRVDLQPETAAPPSADPTALDGTQAPGRPQELHPYSAEPTGVATNVCGAIATNTTWTLASSPYVITCDIAVPTGLVLTIEPGVVVKFTSFYDTVWVDGRLIADGTAAQPITFTSLKDDAAGGDTNGDGGASQPAPNDWDSLRFLPASTGSVLDHAVVRYGGGDWYESVYVSTPDITLTNNTIAYSGEAGIRFDNALPASLTGNSFLNNVSWPAWAPLSNNSQSIILSGNTASGNKVNGFVVTGTIGGNVTWDGDNGFPFLVSGDISINQGARLTLAPRTVVKFHDFFSTLWVNGTLIASSDAANPVVFTSFKDDAAGGDTNGDSGATQPAPNDWDSIRFLAVSAGSVLDHAIVRYGGGDWYENVYVATPDITIARSSIVHSGEIGVRFDGVSPTVIGNTLRDNVVGIMAQNGARPVLHENNILRNRDYGLWNQGSQVIDAEDNWWGSVKGPYDPSDDTATGGLYNPTGDGDKVSDGVDYEPWLALTGLLYGLTVATGDNPVQGTRYGYDDLNRMTSLTASGPVNASYQYSFDAISRITTFGPSGGSPGMRASLEYDPNSRLTRLANRNPSGSVTFNDLRYTYDKAGNVLSAQELGPPAGTTAFNYDAAYQLTGVSGPGLTETYTYDAAGNRTGKNGVTSTFDAANQLLASSDGWTYSYDANGNLSTRTKAGQTSTYTWDVRDRLTRIDYADGSFSAFAYDAQGRRISRRDRQGVTTYFVYEGWNLVQETTPNGVVTANYVYDGPDHLLAMNRDGATYFYLYDRLGSVVGLSNGAGVLAASYRYDPWGNTLASAGTTPNLANPFRYVGREWDGDSGLYYLRGRYYDPQLGRFISRDPLHLGMPGANQYAYAGNNPANATDPMGLDVGDRHWWQAVGGVAVGIGVGIGVTLTAPFSLTGIALAGAAVAAGGLAGGGAAMVSERFLAEECERNYWEAFKAGGKGGMVGGAIGFNVAWLYEAELVAGINTMANPMLANTARGIAQQRLTLELQMSAGRRMMAQAVAKQDWLMFERWQTKMELLQAAMSKLPIW